MYRKLYFFTLALEFVTSLIGLAWLRQTLLGFHNPVEGIMVLISFSYSLWFAVRRVLPIYAVTPGTLELVAEHLYGPSRYDSNWACLLLSQMVGGRYGVQPELWRRWFARQGATLVRDDRVCRFVEAEFADRGSNPTDRKWYLL